MSNKIKGSSFNENVGIIRLLYFIYFTGLCALLFLPSLFDSSSGMNFTGGEPLIKYFTLLTNKILHSSTELSATFPLLESINWIFYLFAGTIVLNLISALIIAFFKNEKKILSILLVILMISTISFSVVFLVYNFKMDVAAKYSVKTIFSIYVCLTVIFTFLISLNSTKNFVKSINYLFSFSILALLLFATFKIGTNNIVGLDSLYLPSILSSNYTNWLNENLLITVNATTTKIIVYAFTATVVLAVINFIINTIALRCNKIRVFDIFKSLLLFLLAVAVLIILKIKADTFIFKQSYGLIAIVGLSLIIHVFSLVIKIIQHKNKDVCSNTNNSSSNNKNYSIIVKQAPKIKTPNLTTNKTVENLENKPKIENVIEENIVDENTEIDSENQDEPYENEVEPLTEKPEQINIDVIPQSPIEQKTIKITKQEKEDKGQQLDFESLKKEILADLYLKEKSSTLTEDKPNIKPSYEINEEPVYKPYSNPYNYNNDTTNTNKKVPVNPYNKPVQTNQNNYSDRFFESLTNSEKEEFDNIFIKTIYGENKRLPVYVIGGDNKEFFNKVFIFIGRYRSIISESLLSKIYLYSTSN